MNQKLRFILILFLLFLLSNCAEQKRQKELLPINKNKISSIIKIASNKDNIELIKLNLKEIIIPKTSIKRKNLIIFVNNFLQQEEYKESSFVNLLLFVSIANIVDEYESLSLNKTSEIDQSDSSYIFLSLVLKNWLPGYKKKLLSQTNLNQFIKEICNIIEFEINSRILEISEDRLHFPAKAELLKMEMKILLELIPKSESSMDDINYIFTKVLYKDINDISLKYFVNVLKGIFPDFKWIEISK